MSVRVKTLLIMSVRVKTLLIKSVFVYLSIVLFVYLCKQSLLCKGLDEKNHWLVGACSKGLDAARRQLTPLSMRQLLWIKILFNLIIQCAFSV